MKQNIHSQCLLILLVFTALTAYLFGPPFYRRFEAYTSTEPSREETVSTTWVFDWWTGRWNEVAR
jgi:hypothetical protein